MPSAEFCTVSNRTSFFDMTYNVHQQVFGLSFASNIVAFADGTQNDLQRSIEEQLPEKLPRVGPNWEIAWGPVVWKNDPSDARLGPDNCWYIARNPSVQFEDGEYYETYVLAIAGAGLSPFDWMWEILDVGTVVDFLDWIKRGIQTVPSPASMVDDATGTYISSGTARGVYILASQRAPQTAAGADQTIGTFLASLSPSPTTRLVVTGLSLAGALSPTLAVGLSKAGVLDRFLPSNVLVYPISGTSPGNGNFAELFASTFPAGAGSGYQIWNHHIVNTLDIIPQLWCTDPPRSPHQNIQNIPTIYGPTLLNVSIAVKKLTDSANKSGVVYTPIRTSFFTGTPVSKPQDTTFGFLRTALPHHFTEYEKYIGVSFNTSQDDATETDATPPRSFCGNCGSPLFLAGNEHKKTIVGSIEEHDWVPKAEQYVQRKWEIWLGNQDVKPQF